MIEEISYWWRVSVVSRVKNVYRGLCNLRRYYSVVYKHRWWDYYFMLEMVDKMLEEREQRWGSSTHYVGDRFTLGRIKVLRRMYKEYRASGVWDEDEMLRRYLSRLARTVPKLWD